MTLNATDRILYNAIETSRLVARTPLKTGIELKRSLHVIPQVAQGLDGKDPDLSTLPMVEMENIIAYYFFGWAVTVSFIGDPDEKHPHMERLCDLDEVWAVCARKPRFTQVRMFGRFLEPGKFIGLALHDRTLLGTRENYHKAASVVPELWTNTLGNVEPFRSSNGSEYFKGGPFRDLDEKT